MTSVTVRLYGTGLYGAGLYGVGDPIVDTRKYPSLFVDRGNNRHLRKDLYYPQTRLR